jgi:hypothetical protein
MPTYTSNFNWAEPLVNNPVDANLWGGYLNGNLTSQDTLIRALANCNIGNAAPVSPVPQAGTLWINNTSPTSWPLQVYDGASWVTIGTINPVTHSFTAGGGFINVQRFSSAGTFTYTPTPGMTFVEVEIVGGGGGGGAVVSSGTPGDKGAGAGGSAGSYCKQVFTAAQIGVSQTLTVGAGGAGATIVAPGSTGSATTFASGGLLMTAPGGLGGGSCHSGFNSGFILTQGGFNNGNSTGGFLNPAGGSGGTGITLNNTIACSGDGGFSFFGAGGDGLATVGVGPAEGNGNNGPSAGSGGGGATMNTSVGTFNGGAGAVGTVIVTEYGI